MEKADTFRVRYFAIEFKYIILKLFMSNSKEILSFIADTVTSLNIQTEMCINAEQMHSIFESSKISIQRWETLLLIL